MDKARQQQYTNAEANTIKMSLPKSSSGTLELWYSIKGDIKTARQVALESLSEHPVDNSVYVLLQMHCDFVKKFEVLNISEILGANLRTGMSLIEISEGLRILAKFAEELLKPTAKRYKYWNKIPIAKKGVPQKWARLEGAKNVLKQLGYTQETSKGLIFPLDSFGPPLNMIKNVAIELKLAAAELTAFYYGHHPHPQYIRDAMCLATATERREFNVMELLAEVNPRALRSDAHGLSCISLQHTDVKQAQNRILVAQSLATDPSVMQSLLQ